MRPHNYSHGMSNTPEHDAWLRMIQRCENPKNIGFLDYGGRGISVCEEWRRSFTAFYAHVGPRPSPKHSIDRFPNNNGNYEPGNVRWATAKEQSLNRRSNICLTIGGVSKTIQEWSECSGVAEGTIRARARRGVSGDALISQDFLRCRPLRRSTDRYLTINGETKTITEWAKSVGLDSRTVWARDKAGWTGESLLLPHRDYSQRAQCRQVTIDGVTMTISQWMKARKISRRALTYRLEKGWPPERIFSPVRYRSDLGIPKGTLRKTQAGGA